MQCTSLVFIEMNLTKDSYQTPDLQFEAALEMNDLQLAYTLASESASKYRWNKLATAALLKSNFELSQECRKRIAGKIAFLNFVHTYR